MRFPNSVIVLAAALAVASGAPAQRGRQGPRNPYAWPSAAELVQRSKAVVAGEVVDARPHWNAERTLILTTVTLRVERSLRGSSGSEVQFQVPGGVVGDVAMSQSHSPRFEPGERVLVFLAGDPGRMPRVTGGEAGKRTLRLGEDGHEGILPPLALDGADRIGTLDELARSLADLALFGLR